MLPDSCGPPRPAERPIRRALRRGGLLHRIVDRLVGRPLRAAHGWYRRLRHWARSTAGRAYRFARRNTFTPLRIVPRFVGFLYLLVWGRRTRRRARRRRAALADTPALAVPRAPQARASLAWRPRVLLVSPYSIYPPNHGGAVRLYNLIRRAGPSVDLHLMILDREGEDPVQRAALEPFCAGVEFHRWEPAWAHDLFRMRPPGEQIFRSDQLTSRLQRIVDEEGIDILQLEYTELGQYALRVRAPRTVITEIDVTFRSRHRRRRAGFHRRYEHDRAFGTTLGDSLRQLRYELEVCGAADEVHVMSEADGEYLASFLADGARRLRVVPNGVDTAALRPPPAGALRRGALFVGNFQHLPNVDAIDWLLTDIWPRVRELRPGATLSVVGIGPPERVLAFDGRDGVQVVGAVPEVAPYLERHRVLIAPIRAGSGTRLKILEAMACGLPVVSTTIGAEGIGGTAGEHYLVADRAEHLARQVIRLLEGEDGGGLEPESLGGRLAAAARRLVEERYDWSGSAERLLDAWWELMPEPARVPPEPAADAAEPDAPEVSIVMPTLDGGEMLGRSLAAIFGQASARRFEVICIDSGSRPEEVERMRRFPIRLEAIDRGEFDHGLTRDRGAALARGRVLVFLNQDAVPADDGWLDRLTAPLFAGDPGLAAVQGGIQELPDPGRRFYWDSCGHRFYFTRETHRWLARYGGIGFSTVNAALRRAAWRRHPFGRAPIMEDKKWQREVVEAGWRIATRADAFVHHTHDYDLRGLVRRCWSEGVGWRMLGERYRFRDMARDLLKGSVWWDLTRGILEGRVRSFAELAFPVVRPWMVYRGNRSGGGVRL